MINVARLCKDQEYEQQLWQEKLAFSNEKFAEETPEEVNRRNDVVANLGKKCLQRFGLKPDYRVKHAVSNNEENTRRFVVEVWVGETCLASSDSKIKYLAIEKAAFRAMEKLQDETL